MQEHVKHRATYQDLLAAPRHVVAEIIGGRLVTHPRPGPRHTVAASRLGRILGRSFDWEGSDGPGGWWLLDEPELHLDDDILVPDLAGWRIERMPRLPETAWFELPPDWLCEVLSPTTARQVKGEKRDIYATHGVGHLWHIDPATRLLESFALGDGKWVLLETYRDAEAVAAPPFEAAIFPLGLLWAD
jgi:Uma2 family endonuclease